MFGFGTQDGLKLLEAAWAGDVAKVRDVLYRKVELVNTPATKAFCRRHAAFDEGVTPLHVAARGGRHDVVELLLSLKADVHATSSRGATALHLAASGQHGTVVRLLMEHGARLDCRDERGHTPCDCARQVCNEEDPLLLLLSAIVLTDRPMTIGRETDCEIRRKSLTLSRRHAQIEPSAEGHVLTDLGSSNGTIVNDQKITRPHPLATGDVITLGAYEFRVEGRFLLPTQAEPSDEELRREMLLRERQSAETHVHGRTMAT